MLKLRNITKNYIIGETVIEALKGIDLEFRKNEFVAVLGPSGCGKTTLLNIIGGLDRYTEGDLQINGRSTKEFRDHDWDSYRNHSIGFVFQNYNLIAHLSVLQNVELALTISGVSTSERRKRATLALEKVGLSDQLHKRPNQLSGGQMQRVAIARALVNNPDILLADEPTGALDSVTSVQIMEILKDISKERLIIMVTHNGELAKEYSTRVIRLLDGKVIGDSNPYTDNVKKVEKPQGQKKTSMSFATALSLSFRNLLTKKTRTFVTAFAGSIGIIGIALVLALSNGFSIYIDKLQADALSYYPINIGSQVPTDTSALNFIRKPKENEFPGGETVYRINREDFLHVNNFTDEYVEYLSKMDPHIYSAIKYSRYIAFNILNKQTGAENNPVYNKLNINWNEMVDNPGLIMNQYDLLKGRMPENMNEMVLVLNSYNQVSSRTLTGLGIPYEGNESFAFDDFLDLEYRLILNNEYYFRNETTGTFSINPFDEKMYDNVNAVPLKVVGILRIKSGTTAGILNEGVNYTEDLTEHVLENETVSDIVMAQKNDQVNIVFGGKFPDGEAGRTIYKQLIRALGGDTTPTGINIYPVDFNSKALIKDYLDAYNLQQTDDKAKILYTDFSEIAAQMMNTMINSVSYILIAFTAVSLVVSSIMIGIITYVSVIERTKEIGVLRSIGARKKDISRVFNAETVIIGFTAGLIGIILSFALTFPINIIIRRLVKEIGANVAILSPVHGILLIAVSIILTLIAGFIPSRIASRKDPVVALRTE